MARPKLFTIAPHAPFLATLVARIADGTLPHPGGGGFGLGDLTILVPTRRARLALADAFLDAFGPALILPDIRALGDADATELPFLPPYEAGPLPLPVGAMERRLTLAELVERWVQTEERVLLDASGFASPPSPAEILALADALGRLIDSCLTEGVKPIALRALAADRDLSEHWQRVLRFLDIALTAWPKILKQTGRADAAAVRDLALDRLTRAVPALFGHRPVIAAGSTGSVPATARLLAAVARRPNGALVLPGLDTELLPEAQAELVDASHAPHGHPQYGLARLLGRLGAGAGEVVELAPAPSPRTLLVRQALALAERTGAWMKGRMSDAEIGDALDRVAILAARSEDEEARAIALCARDVLAAGKSVGIVTPDRTLARRIGAELRRFGIRIDDAAGTPLTQTRAGRLLRGAIAVVLGGWAPVPLMALLRNRQVTLGRSRGEITALADWLEFGLLRGQRLAPGPTGLRAAILANRAGTLDRPALRLGEDQAEALAGLIADLDAALAPLAGLAEAAGFAAADYASALDASFAALTGAGTSNATDPEGGEMLRRFVAETMALPGRGPRFAGRHLAEAFSALTAGVTVRAAAPETVGLALLGLLEARLLAFDLVILAGLNEGVWPASADPGPFLSRNMAIEVGLEPEERRQGQAAHDFEMALGAPQAVLAFATRIGTAPSLPSRLVQRLETYAGAAAGAAMRARGDAHLEAARALDRVAGVVAAPRPMPSPPARLRPRSLSVTEIDKLLRSPYELYARYVLRLVPIDALGADADLAERGTLIHAVLAGFTASGADPADPRALDLLLAEADRRFAGLETLPARRAVWRRRLFVQGERFLAWEAERAPRVAARAAEQDGRFTFAVEDESFELRGRADRIDRLADGSYEIIDFKTGAVPEPRDMKALLAPQLLAEARILAAGGFKGLAAGPVSALTYLKLPADPTGFRIVPFVPPEGSDLAATVDALDAALQRRIAQFLLRDDQPMVPDILPRQNRTYEGDYDHLSRRAEWAASADAEEGE